MEKLVSVIVPIYRTEKYLMKCVSSILEQTYKHLEIILVNDGSPDNSLALCRKFEQQDKRIKVIDKPNGGLSSARNAGLCLAKGEYITFVDSDDYLEKEAVFHLLDAIEKTQADISCMQTIAIDEKYEKITRESYGINKVICKSGYDYLKLICKREASCAVWDKMFASRLFEKVSFEEKTLNEDFLFLSQLMLLNCVNVAITSYHGYNYYTRSNSISRCGFGKASVDAVYNTTRMKQLASTEVQELAPYFGAYAAYQARTALLLMNVKQYEDNKVFADFCYETIRNNKRYFYKYLASIKDIIFCELYLCFPQITLSITNAIRRSRI